MSTPNSTAPRPLLPFHAEPPCPHCGESPNFEMLGCDQCPRDMCAHCWESSPYGHAWGALAHREPDRYNDGDMPPILCPTCSAGAVVR